jgi:predicted ATPase/DNA-binding NarL/FixJ family response regulator
VLSLSKPQSEVPPLHLPRQPTPFIGRAEEVAQIKALLADPACCLLTLVGPGGIGKTRLAIQVGLAMPASFRHGIYFVSLQSIYSTEFLLSTMADTLGFSLRGLDDPQVLLLNYLHDKEMLLILDNFEQLLAPTFPAEGGVALLTSILETAPAVKLLVTSREVLNLQEEWLYPLQGLAFPPSILTSLHVGEEEAYNAVQLFVERARRVRRDFSLSDEQAGVVQICQLVKGMPLALELAASWTKTFQCQVIAAEIQRNLDFLTTKLRNIPERQRSMRAVFDHSWQLLTEEERHVFKRLSVFRDGFRRQAAEQVARATLPILTNLVDKSLLRWEADGRYQIHELLRQYAAEHLVLSPDDVAHVYDRHCAYYADFLHRRQEDIVGARQREVIREIAAELDNIQAAWQWAVQQADPIQIQKAAFSFFMVCDSRGRFREGAEALEKAVQSLNNPEPSGQRAFALAGLFVMLGGLYIRLGRLEEAKTVLERSQAIFNDLAMPPPPGFGTDPLTHLGILANVCGDYSEAARLGEKSRQLNEARADKHNLQMALYVLAEAAFAQGHYEAAWRYGQQAHAVTEETNNRWFMVYILHSLGHVARARGDYAQAQQHYQASYAIATEMENAEGMAVALNYLGKIAYLQQSYREAEQLYRQSLVIYQTIGDQGGLATTLTGLGATAYIQGQYQAARAHFQRALQVSSAIRFIPLTLSILIQVGELLWQIGQPERCIELLILVQHHLASDHETKIRAQQLLARYEADLPPDVFATATQPVAANDLETVIAAVQTDLAVFRKDEGGTSSREHVIKDEIKNTTFQPSAFSPQPLVEPLTPRELEVLRLIAEGMTNQQIAETLIISVGTAKFYTSQIYSKLTVSSRTQAVARAREVGLLS